MPLPEITSALSPMMRQYVEIKRQHADMLLFYRLGDFYELFFDDAQTASRELELVLTGRDCGLKDRAPMCGVPYHSYESYVAKLIAKGYKVAICEQTEDPSKAKGIVQRGVVRIITPGTVIADSMLSEGENNYICSIFAAKGGFGFAVADVSTGCVQITETDGRLEDVLGELGRFEPREILGNTALAGNSAICAYAQKVLNIKIYTLYDAYFHLDAAKEVIAKQFKREQTEKLRSFSLGYAVCALGALIKYLTETQFHGVSRIVEVEGYICTQYLALSANCRRNLELVENMRTRERRGSLMWAIDRTRTSMGKRMLRLTIDRPLILPEEINRRLDAVEELCANPVPLVHLRDILDGIMDIERLMTRVIYRSATPRDVVGFSSTFQKIGSLRQEIKRFSSCLLADLSNRLDPLKDVCQTIEAAVVEEPPALFRDGGYIRAGYDKEVDELRELLGNSKSYLTRMEASLKETTGIRNLKVGYNRVFGYYIEISKSNTKDVPDNFIRRQTLTSGERYVNEELKDLESKILSAGERLNLLERQHFENLLTVLESNLQRVQSVASAVSYLDVLCSFALAAHENNYVRPTVDDGTKIQIQSGRHPVVERVAGGSLFVPNNALLDAGKNLVHIITGPNMAGKSTFMRQTALIVLMAQMGCFVPAASAHIGVVDAIFTRIGASDDLFFGDSTFMVEMKEVAEILRSATPKSLIILDEIGRGTSTYDGMSIARSIVEAICCKGGYGVKTMFATHYHEMTELAHVFDNVQNFTVAVKKKGDEITFLRRIVPGATDDSYGIEVAKLAGLPEKVIIRAKEVLRTVERRESGSSQQPREEEDDGTQSLKTAISSVNIETLTPVEALMKLYELQSIVCSKDE